MIKKFGGKWVFGVGTLIDAILGLCSPMVAKFGTGAYVILRILQGISEVNIKTNFIVWKIN